MDRHEITRGFYSELVARGRSRFGTGEARQHLARYRNSPRDFAYKILDSQWWSAQEEVGKAIVKSRRVVVKSGNGVGKTYLAADLALWFLYTHRPAVVVTTAPTDRQVRHVLWREIHQRHNAARKRLPGRPFKTRIELGTDSIAIGLAAESGVTFQGFHGPNLLIIMEEAGGIPDEIWDAAEGVAVGENNKILAIGNPLLASGRFYQNFKGASGWKRVTISALQHPNVTGAGKTIPGCVTAAHIEEKLAEWCEEQGIGERESSIGREAIPDAQNSEPDTLSWRRRRYIPNDLFRARILGEFPTSEDNALIPLRWIEAAVARSLPQEGYKRAAVDVARFGSDSTVIGIRVGSVLTRMEVIRGADTNEVVGAIKRIVYDEHPSSVAVDDIGLGAGVLDRLHDDGLGGFFAVNVAKAAFDSEHYANRRAELYWGLRERFRIGDIQIKDDPELVEELSSIRYHLNAMGKIQIEEKHRMKQRLRRSPDRADMLMMLFDSSMDWINDPSR
jgi:hypothetical protein